MKLEKNSSGPRISELNRRNAISNITIKLGILKKWAKEGIPLNKSDVASDIQQVKVKCALEYFPNSIRQFNLWDGSQNSEGLRLSIPTIARNANDTLRKQASLRTEVEQLLAALKLRAVEQARNNKSERLYKLRESLKLEQRLREILEQQIVTIRRELKAEQLARNKLQRRFDGQVDEFRLCIKKLTDENAILAKENAALIKNLSKVTPLRRV